jgi:hypothetical protein
MVVGDGLCEFGHAETLHFELQQTAKSTKASEDCDFRKTAGILVADIQCVNEFCPVDSHLPRASFLESKRGGLRHGGFWLVARIYLPNRETSE